MQEELKPNDIYSDLGFTCDKCGGSIEEPRVFKDAILNCDVACYLCEDCGEITRIPIRKVC